MTRFTRLGLVAALALAALPSGAAAQGAPAEAAQPVFAISYRAGPKWKPGVPMAQQGLRDHYFYWKALSDGGRVVMAGPVGPDGGLILLHARDQADADRVIAEDPASIAGVFVGEARPFIPRFVGKVPLTPVGP